MPLLPTKSSAKYTQLLIVLIFRFLTSPFLEGSIGSVISSLIMFLILISIVRLFSARTYIFFIYTIIASLAFFIDAIANFGSISVENTYLGLLILITWLFHSKNVQNAIDRKLTFSYRLGHIIKAGISI